MPTLPVTRCPNCRVMYSLEDYDSCPGCEKVPEGTKRWRMTIELVLDSPDVKIGGSPVTEQFVRERTENALASLTKTDSPGTTRWWTYHEAQIKKITEVKNG